MLEARRWHRLVSPLVAIVLGLALGPPGVAAAIYQGSVYSNVTAFDTCDGTPDTISRTVKTLARDALAALTYATTAYETSGFTRATVLARTPADFAVYVHSHGDQYWTGGRQVQGFLEDGGDCSQARVYATDVAARRDFAARLVVMSTCHLGEAPKPGGAPAMSQAYGIEQLRSSPDGSGYRGPEFFLGYTGLAYTADQLRFERSFWGYLATHSAGDAFALALRYSGISSATHPTWFGSYTYWGFPVVSGGCQNCI